MAAMFDPMEWDRPSSDGSIGSFESNPTVSKADQLLSLLNIHISGAVGPARGSPLEVFRPVHQIYEAAVRPDRVTEWGRTSETGGYIQDRDLVTTWRLPSVSAAQEVFFWEKAFENALGMETMYVVMEAFVEEEPAFDALPIPVLLCRFAAFVNTLGTQPVTITLSSIVSDMISDHASSGGHAIWFSDVGYLQTAVENFVMTRECFFHHPDRAPFVEAAFQATNIHAGHMDIDIHYRWNPPRVEFHGLKNVVSEGDLVSLRPTVANIRPPHGPFEHSSFLVQVEFYTGSDDAWLKWNSGQEAFQGTVGHRIAENSGASRLSVYTIKLELTALVIQHFPRNVRLERIIRCDVPLTIKRTPDNCGQHTTYPLSPKDRHPMLKHRAPDFSRQCHETNHRDGYDPSNKDPLRISHLQRPLTSRANEKRFNTLRSVRSTASNKHTCSTNHSPFLEKQHCQRGTSSYLEELFRATAPAADTTDYDVRTVRTVQLTIDDRASSLEQARDRLRRAQAQLTALPPQLESLDKENWTRPPSPQEAPGIGSYLPAYTHVSPDKASRKNSPKKKILHEYDPSGNITDFGSLRLKRDWKLSSSVASSRTASSASIPAVDITLDSPAPRGTLSEMSAVQTTEEKRLGKQRSGVSSSPTKEVDAGPATLRHRTSQAEAEASEQSSGQKTLVVRPIPMKKESTDSGKGCEVAKGSGRDGASVSNSESQVPETSTRNAAAHGTSASASLPHQGTTSALTTDTENGESASEKNVDLRCESLTRCDSITDAEAMNGDIPSPPASEAGSAVAEQSTASSAQTTMFPTQEQIRDNHDVFVTSSMFWAVPEEDIMMIDSDDQENELDLSL